MLKGHPAAWRGPQQTKIIEKAALMLSASCNQCHYATVLCDGSLEAWRLDEDSVFTCNTQYLTPLSSVQSRHSAAMLRRCSLWWTWTRLPACASILAHQWRHSVDLLLLDRAKMLSFMPLSRTCSAASAPEGIAARRCRRLRNWRQSQPWGEDIGHDCRQPVAGLFL